MELLVWAGLAYLIGSIPCGVVVASVMGATDPRSVGSGNIGATNVGRMIGKKAGVVVDKEAGKYATAHDLRRSFGTRWASKVKAATLQLLMRHEDIQTTMRYYVGLEVDVLPREHVDRAVATDRQRPTVIGRERTIDLPRPGR